MARSSARLSAEHSRFPSTTPRVHVQTLGASQVQVGQHRISPVAETNFAVLVRVLYAPGMQVDREHLLASLWPGMSESRQRGNLRQALYKLRQTGVLMELEGQSVRLDERQIARTFSIERTSENFERDVIEGHEPFGMFLPGFEARSAEYNDWLHDCRELVHGEVRRVLVTQLRARRERADWVGAERMSRWLLQFDPLNEEATLTLAECAALSGGKAQALEIIDRYLQDLGPEAGEIRIPAATLRRRIAEPAPRRLSFAPSDRHFVGREEEMADLTLALRRARWHDGSAHLIHGPPGMGKTRLTLEVGKVATLEGIYQIRLSCRESDVSRQLSLVLELVSELLSAPGALGCTPESLRHLRRLVGEEPAVLDEHGMPLPREPLPSPGAMRRAIADVLSAVSEEKPVYLVVDDVHWLDTQSWDVLADLIDRSETMRVCLVLTSRTPHACAHRPERVPGRLKVRELGRLSDSDSLRLAQLLMTESAAELVPEAQSQLADAADGSPMFVRELVAHWSQYGSLDSYPPTLLDAVNSNLSRLSSHGLRILQVASLVGNNCSSRLIHEVLEISASLCADCLDEVSRHYHVQTRDDGTIHVHHTVAACALASLSSATRRLLHARIGATLMKIDAVSFRLNALKHFQLSGDMPLLKSASREAINEYRRRGDPHRAIEAFEMLFSASPGLREDPDWQREHRLVLFECGRYSTLVESYGGRHKAEAISSWDIENPDEALRLIWSASYYDRSFLRELAARALLIAESPKVDVSIKARAVPMILKLSVDGDTPEFAKRAYSLLPVIEPISTRLQIALNHVFFHTVYGDLKQSRSSAFEALGLVGELPLHEQSPAYVNLAYAFRFTGDCDEAERLLKERHAFAVKHEENVQIAMSAYYSSVIALEHRNDANSSMEWLKELERIVAVNGEPSILIAAAFHRPRVLLELGRTEEARQSFDNARARYNTDVLSAKHRQHISAISLGICISEGNRDAIIESLKACWVHYDRIKDRPASEYIFEQLLRAAILLGEQRILGQLVAEIPICRQNLAPLPPKLAELLAAASSRLNCSR